MRKLLLVTLLVLALVGVAKAQSPSPFPYAKLIPNDTATGTTLFKLTKINASGNAVIMGTSDTNGFAGVCVKNCGKSGNALVAFAGLVPLTVDGTTTIQDYIQISSSVGGDGTDTTSSSYPTSGGDVIGRVQTASSGAGSVSMVDLFPSEDNAASGGGGSGCIPPGSTSNAVLFDAGSGTCHDITKWTSNGTTTITGAATSVLDLSLTATKVAGTTGQLLYVNGSNNIAAEDPIISYNYVNLLSAAVATAQAAGSATRVSTFGAYGTLYFTFASITGSPLTCTVQIVNYDSLGNAINNGSAISVTPSNGTTSATFIPGAGLFTTAQMSATFHCGTYPSTGTVSVDYVPGITTYTVLNPETTKVIGEVNQGTSPWIVAGGGTAGSAASGVVTVQGIAGGTTLPVTATIAAAQTIAVTNTGTFAVQAAQATAANLNATVVGSGVFEVAPTTAANTLANQFFTQLSDGTHGQTFMSTTTSSKYGADMNILSILGTAPTTAGFIDIKGADGNVFVRQATAANLNATVVPGGSAIFEVAPTTAANTVSNQFFTQLTDGTHGVTINSTTYTSKYGLDANLLGTLGTAFKDAGYVTVEGGAADGSASAGNPVIMAGKGSGDNRVPIVCDNYVPFSLASTTSLKIVTKTTGKNVYICSINIVSAAANNVALIAGTKTTTDCDTSTAGLAGGTTAATGWNFAANGGLTHGTGIGAVAWTATTGLDVCLLASGSGQVSGGATWTQF